MSKWKIYTPEGVQDILFEDCAAKRELEGRLRQLFGSYGYFEVETPSIEFYDVFTGETEIMPQDTMFKFYDQQGRILVLRPDITIPVARIAATKYRDAAMPLRFSYIGNVFRYNDYGGGKQNEFTQAGIEVLGVNTPESDAEVIAIAINSLMASGLEDFQVDIGQVEFFKGLMEETRFSEAETGQIKTLIDRKDFVGIEEMLAESDVREDIKKLIFDLPSLFGSTDVIDKVEALSLNKRSLEALENIRQVLEILEDYGLGKYVSVDLGMLGGLNYDTGIIFRGFTYGVGFPVLTGARYDRLVSEFGKSCPATGFSLGVGMVMTALQRQKGSQQKLAADTLLCYNPEGRKQAFMLGEELRRQGLKVELELDGRDMEQIKAYAENKGIGGLLKVLDSENVEVYNLAAGSVSKASFEELFRRA